MSVRSATLPRSTAVSKPRTKAPAKSTPSAPAVDLSELLLNEARHGILVLDPALRVQFRNQSLIRLFPNANLEPGVPLIQSGAPPELFTAVKQALDTGLRAFVQVRIPQGRQEGGESIYRIEAAPLPTRSKAGAWLIVEDITEQLHTEQIRKDFVTNASHELRTPLALIHGYIETLQSGMFKGATSMQRCLEVMEKHSRRMMRIIEDMLTISRLESGDSQLRCEPFSVKGCVEDVLEHLTPLIDLRQPLIRIDFPQNCILHGDRFYWDQIFTNLIENSLKENARLGMTLSIGGTWSDKDVVLTVADSGVGIPAEDLPFVFKRFFRCAKHHSQEIKGTGLGLSIVKRAVEAHGGTISVRSIPDIETVFTMRVPLSQPAS